MYIVCMYILPVTFLIFIKELPLHPTFFNFIDFE
jgi:hypothetical protein